MLVWYGACSALPPFYLVRDTVPAILGYDLRIPCEASLRWRRIRLFVPLPVEPKALYDLGNGAPSSDSYWALGVEGDGCHSHAQLYQRDPNGPEEDAGERWAVDVITYRNAPSAAERERGLISHENFFSLLAQAVDYAPLHAIAEVDLLFLASSSRWRISLLSDPPEFGELGTELGVVSLSGLKLRFSDSAAGMIETELEISPREDECRVSAVFLEHLSLDDDRRSDVYTDVVRRSEEVAALFISSISQPTGPGATDV